MGLDYASALREMKTGENLVRYCEEMGLERRGHDTYVCPLCGSGTGPNRSAAFKVFRDRATWKCFSCGEGGDILDLVAHLQDAAGFAEQVSAGAEVLGMAVPEGPRRPGARDAQPRRPIRPKRVEDHASEREGEAKRVRRWAEAYPGSPGEAYARDRGIAAYPCHFGWDAERGRLVIPWPNADWYHIDRDTTGRASHKYDKPRRSSVGAQPLFEIATQGKDALVVVEGALDAYALASVGIEGIVALCGTGYMDLLHHLRDMSYQGGVVLMLDHDQAGAAACAKALDDLRASHVAALAFEWAEGDPKDPDECVRAGGGESLAARVRMALADAADLARGRDRNPNMALFDPAEVATSLYLGRDLDTPIPTGFTHLDSLIGGGLMRGLYVLGATSSFGKTTFSEQLASHVAASGHPVLFVTIEQSAAEIVAKSLSRRTHDRHASATGGISAQEICNAACHAAWDAARWAELAAAAEGYASEVAPNLRILEGVHKPLVADVRQATESMRAAYGAPPVVVIDYLQLLAAPDARATDKMAVDANVTELRMMARDLRTPVWCVATLNRESYSGPVDFESYKESGAVEYGADYLLALQPRGIAQEVAEVKTVLEKKLRGNAFVARAKREVPRRVELTLLKNRHGVTTGNEQGLPLSYFPRTNLFVELGPWEDAR